MDLITLFFALIALGLFIYKTFRYRNAWKGYSLIIDGEGIREIMASNNFTLTVDGDFIANSDSEYIIK